MFPSWQGFCKPGLALWPLWFGAEFDLDRDQILFADRRWRRPLVDGARCRGLVDVLIVWNHAGPAAPDLRGIRSRGHAAAELKPPPAAAAWSGARCASPAGPTRWSGWDRPTSRAACAGLRPTFCAPYMMVEELLGAAMFDDRATTRSSLRRVSGPGARRGRGGGRAVHPGPHRELGPGRRLRAPAGHRRAAVPPVNVFIRAAAWVTMVVVGLVQLRACTNLACFLLARALDRRREIAVRWALGSSRGSLVRRLLGETTLRPSAAAPGGARPGPRPERPRVHARRFRSWPPLCSIWWRPCRARDPTWPTPSISLALLVGAGQFLGSSAGAGGRPGLRPRAGRRHDLFHADHPVRAHEARVYARRLLDRFRALPGVEAVGASATCT